MERMIKVRWLGRSEAQEVDIQEAERILEHAYNSGETGGKWENKRDYSGVKP